MPRKKRRRKVDEIAYYHVQITGWDWDLSFGLNAAKWEDKRYSDYRHLQIRGTLLRPRKLNVEEVELTVLPTVKPEEFETTRDRPPRRCVGALNVRGSKSEPRELDGHLSMPADALVPVLQMLIAGRFKYVLMDGEPMRYRQALICHYTLTEVHDEAEYPDDE